MTKVDFYGLETDNMDDCMAFACRLINKVYQRRHNILVATNNQAEAEKLDELLWQLEPESFVPHNLAGEGPSKAPPVQITWHNDALQHHDVLLNLSDKVVDFYGRFERVLEIIATEHASAEQGRERFRFYKERGHPLKFHKQKVDATS